MSEDNILNNEEVQALIEKQVMEKLEAAKTAAVDEATRGLTKNRDTILDEKKRLKAELDDLRGKYNFEELDEKLAKIKETEEANLSAEEKFKKREKELIGNFSIREKELLGKHESSVTALQDQLSKKDAALRKVMVEDQLHKDIVAAGGIPELLLPVMRNEAQVVEENGQYVVRVMKDGVARVGDSSGNPMTTAQLVDDYRSNPVFGRAFHASGATGGDAQGNNSNSASGSNKKRSEMSVSEKTAFIDKHGLDKFNKLDF